MSTVDSRQGTRRASSCHSAPRFPRTRYQGSKRRLAGQILAQLRGISYHTVLDAFGGTGAVAHAFKAAGKAVTYNDLLAFNHQIGLALIENSSIRLTAHHIRNIGTRRPGSSYGDVVERHFPDIYFTNEENCWLDMAAGNIRRMENRYARALAWYAVFQAAMAKRPYNLFHRRNLYMRTADVRRGFGNKASWDRSFDDHVAVFAREANAAVFDSGVACRALCGDALALAPGFDLVYIDPPYVRADGAGVDYRAFYHFLEGLVHYDTWEAMIDHSSAHRRLTPRPDPWTDARLVRDLFAALFAQFRESVLVVSYRGDGVPGVEELAELLRGVKRSVRVTALAAQPYALSTNRASREVLLIGT